MPSPEISPARLIDRFAALRVAVVGDPILDTWLTAGDLRWSREAPVPDVSIVQRADAPGGAANAAANAAALGAQVELIAAVGDDAPGAALLRALQAHGVGTARVAIEPGRQTRCKQRVVADRQLLLSFATGAAAPLAPATEAQLVDRLLAACRDADLVLVADYGYGLLSDAAIDRLARHAAHRRAVLVVDSRRRLGRFAPARPDAAKPSFEESCALLGSPLPADGRADQLAARSAALLAVTGARLVAATLDRDGVLLLSAEAAPLHLPGRGIDRPLVAGAGDAFCAALGLALAAGAPAALAGRIAQAAASTVVAGVGTSACRAAELRAALGESPDAKLLPDLAALARCAQAHRAAGRRIVFANGCFDLLHAGHVALLDRARALGDVLIVAVNGDAGIRRLKGAGRPINTLPDRLRVLAALASVDHLIAFDSDTAHALVAAARPDVFVKGGNWQGVAVPEAALAESLGGRVHVFPPLAERTTGGLLAHIARADAGIAA